MSDKKTICLNMIVKNEAHIIADTLEHLLKYITFDYWVISDTGSTDATKQIIRDFFAAKGVPGELVEHEWQDFGHNRTKAFESAYNKTDYVFVWDADDEISGDFKMPVLVADSYKFIFGNASGFRYSRPQMFNNRKKWCYRGVLHEYAACLETVGPCESVLGPYYFISGRKGDRSKDPNKYLKDALVLEKALEAGDKDPLYARYVYYCAQSYNSCNRHEKAIEYYKKALTVDTWIQEKYVSCFEIYEQYERLGRAADGLYYLVESFKYDSTRVEGIYRLIKYYCINKPVEVAYAYYGLISDFYENRYDGALLGEKLFAKKEEYDFYLPYYMVIVAQRTGHMDVAVKMYLAIFKNAYVAPEWWIRNLVHNFQFCLKEIPKNTNFLQLMLDYFELVRARGIVLEEVHYGIIGRAVDTFREELCRPLDVFPLCLGPFAAAFAAAKPRVMLTVTTCKRLDLFTKTVNSILNTWTDVAEVDYFYCVDDNSSDEDRSVMRSQYPFFNYYMKGAEERGHRESMNIIWAKLAELRPTYWIHLEDDWLYFKKGAYVGRAIAALETYGGRGVHQVVFNRNYGLMYSDLCRVGGEALESGLVLHEHREGLVGKNCGYWPHYSLQPSLVRTSAVLELGNYDSPNKFFERDYANRWAAKGYKTAFFDGIYSIHIGKQHWEKDGKNAYALNEVPQFGKPGAEAAGAAELRQVNEPLPASGTMSQHLASILDKIRSGTPFGLIRPSDGERMVMLGQTLTNCDAWTFRSGGKLQKDLLEAVRTVDPNLYVGIPCNTCSKAWNCTPEIYRDFIDTFKIPLAQRTYANIFGNSNWQAFADFIQAYKKGFFLITSGMATSTLAIKERFIISDKLVNTWDTDGDAETGRLLRFIASKKGELVLFSAGPLSKVWIPKCMAANPNNMYVDVGASVDIFTKGVTNRSYTKNDHPFAKESCRFDNPPKKNLVYMCVFHKKAYIELLRLLMLSVKIFSRTDTIDFLVFTSEEFKSDIDSMSVLLEIPIKAKIFHFTSMHESTCARLFIFEYEKIYNYEKVLYLDTDIIIQNDLEFLFNKDIEERVYAMKEGTIEHEYHGAWFFDFSKMDKNISGMNSGILLFKPTREIHKIFSEIIQHIKDMKDNNKKLPACMDQPFLNYHIINNDKHNTVFLEKYGLIYCYDPPPPPSAATDVIICHFVWPIGNAGHKKERMLKHATHIMNHYLAIKGGPAGPSLCNTYLWNKSCIMKFCGGILETSWKNGNYTWLDANTIKASWNDSTYLFKMNSDYTSFLSVRISDMDCVKGVVVSQKKHLVYLCVFFNPIYIDLLGILMKTVAFYSKTDDIDFLILTSEDFKPLIDSLSALLEIPIKTKIFNFVTVFEAMCARLLIFDYEDIEKYEKVLYIDTDIIVQNDLNVLFDQDIGDRVYGVKEGVIGDEYFGGWFFDFSKYDKNAAAMNSGTLLFRPSSEIRRIFAEANAHIMRMRNAGETLPLCIDQPFLNYHLRINDKCDVEYMNKYVLLYHNNPPPPPVAPTDVIMCHFSWPYGNAKNKKERISKYVTHILSKYTVLKGSGLVGQGPHVSGGFHWGNNGQIELEADGLLKTTWGNGSYKWLDMYTLEASWRGNSHILRMNSDYTKFLSLRLGDIDCIKGRKI